MELLEKILSQYGFMGFFSAVMIAIIFWTIKQNVEREDKINLQFAAREERLYSLIANQTSILKEHTDQAKEFHIGVMAFYSEVRNNTAQKSKEHEKIIEILDGIRISVIKQ